MQRAPFPDARAHTDILEEPLFTLCLQQSLMNSEAEAQSPTLKHTAGYLHEGFPGDDL